MQQAAVPAEIGAGKLDFQAIIDCSDDAIFATSLNGRILSWNRGAERVFGYEAREMVGQPLASLCPPARLHEQTTILSQILQGQKVDHFETVRLRQDGTEVHVSVTVSPVRDRQGHIIGTSTIARDITQRVEADRQLAELHQQACALAAIVDCSDDAIVGKTLDGTVRTWNPAAERIFGYAASEMLGRSILAIFPPDRLHEEEQILSKVRRGERITHYETERLHRSGKRIHVSVTVSPITDRSGQITGVAKIARDNTERANYQRALWREAHHDPLTGLPNRRLLVDRSDMILSRAISRGAQVGLLYLDLDGFKQINDTWGHEAGDHVLRVSAERMAHCMRESDMVARLGGDEFVAILSNLQSARDAEEVAHRLVERLQEPIALPGRSVAISTSIGVAMFPGDAQTLPELLNEADAALYCAKQRGRNRICLVSNTDR